MNSSAPSHILKYCHICTNDPLYQKLNQRFGGDYSFCYKIQCTCRSCSFSVFMDQHPTITLKCVKCQENIEVYDLKYYPCATKLTERFPSEMVRIGGEQTFSVYASYEYSDEFEYEDDVPFDPNDITWVHVWIAGLSSGKIIELVNDETC